MNRRKVVGVTAVVLAVLAAPFASVADSHPRGTARSSIALISTGGYVGGAGELVEVAIGSGMATSDPGEQSLAYNTAFVDLNMARASGAVTVDPSLFDVYAGAEANPSESDGDTDFSLAITGFEEIVSGLVEIGTVHAEADAAHAASYLAQVEISATVLKGLVTLSGVTIVGSDHQSHTASSSTSQHVTIERSDVFSIGALLEQFGKTLEDLDVEGLVDLGAALGMATQTVEDAKALVETIESDQDRLDKAVADLQDADLSNDPDAIAEVLDLAGDYNVPVECDPLSLTYIQCILAVADAVADAIDVALTEATEALQDARAGLEADILGLPLIRLTNVVAKVDTVVTGNSSSASAEIDWETAEVAGVEVPRVPDLAQMTAALRDAVQGVLDALGAAVGLDMTLQLDFALRAADTGTSGEYHTASAALTLLDIGVTAVPSGSSGPTAGSTPLVVSTTLLGMTALPEHRPVSSEDPCDLATETCEEPACDPATETCEEPACDPATETCEEPACDPATETCEEPACDPATETCEEPACDPATETCGDGGGTGGDDTDTDSGGGDDTDSDTGDDTDSDTGGDDTDSDTGDGGDSDTGGDDTDSDTGGDDTETDDTADSGGDDSDAGAETLSDAGESSIDVSGSGLGNTGASGSDTTTQGNPGTSPSEGGGGPGSESPDTPLAKTGPAGILPLIGFGLVAFSMRVRRSLSCD